ncbi:MAG: O-phosphoserine--tRNA ligase [Candidatus Methanospirareceae archaeon]
MKFDPKDVRAETSADFESAWMRGVQYASKRGLNEGYPRSLRQVRWGKPHPVLETIQALREAYLRLGFEEMINPVIIDAEDVKRQFGKEALAVLDRCYYLAGLPRPDIGISDERIQQMNAQFEKELSKAEIAELRETLHRYKRGEIGGDDLVYELAQSLSVEDMQVTKVLDTVFPELREIAPVASNATLRSHMTSGWFLTLAELVHTKPLPIRLFSVDRCFRREQREDEIRLRSYHSASCVLSNEDGQVSLDDGKEVATGLLLQFGFRKIRFRPDEKRSKYYMPDTQTEVFCHHPRLGWVELATFGIYSPTALAQYDIPYPIMNLGLGVERLAMIVHESDDVRALVFPQFNAPAVLSDLELAELIRLEKTPQTPEGAAIEKSIVQVCDDHGSAESPCEFLAYTGPICGKQVVVKVIEPEENTRLCGPATQNELVVFDGSVQGLPRTEKWAKQFEEGVPTNIRFLDAFAALAAATIEDAARTGELAKHGAVTVNVKIVRSGADINIVIDDVAARYITSTNRKLDIRGPVFLTVIAKLV